MSVEVNRVKHIHKLRDTDRNRDQQNQKIKP